jgi:hypothetical protein
VGKVALGLLWAAVICGGAGIFFAVLFYESRYENPPELVDAVAATVLLVLAGGSVLALAVLQGVAKMLEELNR